MRTMFRTPALLAAGALVAVVLTPGSAVAASVKTVLLGRSNSTTATTTISNSKGTPLSLKAKSGHAPLAVSSTTKVTNLNADRLDGLSSTSFLGSTSRAADSSKLAGLPATSFARSTGRTGIVESSLTADAEGLGVVCPKGTILTGGGGAAATGPVAYSGPDFDADDNNIPNSWLALGFDEMAHTYAVCYSPSGAPIVGAVGAAQATQLMRGTAATVHRLKAAARAH